MTLQFPSDPINGAVSGDYTYDAAKGAWRKNAALPVSVTHSDVAPSNPREGDQWWKSDEGTLFTYYNDGNSSQWVESTNVIANVEPNPIPAGAMMAWASDIVPANWLLCDGSAVSRSTYASLFASIGTIYGIGDGTTTFNLPNIKGRTIVGQDATQTEFDTLGETGGAKTHTLTSSEMPSHTHSFSGTTSTTGSHVHQQSGKWSSYSSHNHYSVAGTAQASDPSQGDSNSMGNTYAAGDHSHTFSGTTGTAGSGSAHNNLQPYIVLNYIIKFSAGETPGDSQLAVRVGTLETQNNATPLSQNYIINGAFDIWQRGTSTSTTGFLADRWQSQAVGGSGYTQSRQVLGLDVSQETTGGEFFFRQQHTVGSGAGDYSLILTRIEDVRTLANKTVTFSFWATADSARNLSVEFSQYFGSGGSATVFSIGVTKLAVTTTITRYTVTATMPSITGKTVTAGSFLEVLIWFDAGSNFNSRTNSLGHQSGSYTFNVWGAQLEVGQYATPFRRNAPSIQAELAACQRYYFRFKANGAFSQFGYATSRGGNICEMPAFVPVEMRIAPTAVDWSGIIISLFAGGSGSVANTIAINAGSNNKNMPNVSITTAANIGTAGQAMQVIANNNTSAFIGFSAEL